MKVRAEMGVSGHARWFERLLSELLFFQLFMPWVAVLTRISRLTKGPRTKKMYISSYGSSYHGAITNSSSLHEKRLA